MATASTLLSSTETAITALLDVMADPSVQEYQIGNRRVRRAEFGPTLDALMKTRDRLKREVARSSNRPVRVVRLGRANPIDR